MKRNLMLVVAWASGFIALSYEILWYRVFAFASRGRPSAFGLLLAFYLVGVAVGAAVTKPLCKDLEGDRRNAMLRIIAIFAGCASVASYFVIPLTARLATTDVHLPGRPAWEMGFLLVMIAAGSMGAVLPLVAHFGIDADDRAGLQLGYVYLANIIGSTLGSLLTGFVLMEIASTRAISTGLACAGLGMSLMLVVISGSRGKTLGSWALAIGAAVAFVAVSGGFAFRQIYERLLMKGSFTSDSTFVDVLENRHGVIVVDKNLEVYGGGAYDGAFNVSLVDDRNRIERAFAVEVLHPHPKQMLMIGLASGSWAQALASFPGLEHLTIVEIDPGYLDLIPKHPEVASILTNPKVTIVIDDGRRWLLRHPDAKFDVIVMNTTWHWRAHVTNLLSRDFLEIARAHLLPGGLHYFNTTSSDAVQRTAVLEFPYAMRFENFMAVSDSPITFDRNAWRDELANATVEGQRVLDPSREEDRKVLDGIASIVDASPEQWASMESREAILARTEGAREVTDDNMACEWDQVPPANE